MENVHFNILIAETINLATFRKLQADEDTGDLYALASEVESPSYIFYISSDETKEDSIISPTSYDGVIADIALDAKNKKYMQSMSIKIKLQ